MSSIDRNLPAPLTISAEPDDSTYRGRKNGGGGGGGRPAAAGRSFGLNVFLVIIIAALAVAGWFIANQHQQIQADAEDLAVANERLARLEQRLQATDEVFTEVGQETSEEINFWESEVRKLWDARKLGKQQTDSNTRAIKASGDSLAKLESQLSGLQADLDRALAAAAQQPEIIAQLTSMDTSLKGVADNAAAARQSVNALNARIAETEQGLAAFDAFRLQLNRRLSEIERRLDGLAASPGL